MSRTIATLVIGLICLSQPALAAEQVAVKSGTDADALARLERLEQMANEQGQRLESLQAKTEELTTPGPGAERVAEVRKVVAELMADAEFRDSLYPAATNAGYDARRGFYIDSADQAFSLNIKGYMQVRYTGINRQTDNPNAQGRQKRDDINAFEIERLFLAFSGHIHSPKILYRIVVDGGYTKAVEDGQWKTYYATVDFEYLKDQYLLAGLMRLPFGGQAMTAGAVLQMMDRSEAQYAFAPDRSIGIMAHGNLFDNRLTYFAAIANGMLNADDGGPDTLDTNFAYYARAAYYLFGKGNSLRESRVGYPESDLPYHKDPEWRIAASMLYNDNNGDAGRGGPPGLWAAVPDNIRAGRGIGGNELISSVGTDNFTLSFDSGFKYRGFSVNAEYYLRMVDGEDEFSQWELRTGKSGTTHQQGGHLQVGYFIVPKKFEVAARLGGIWDNAGDNVWEWGFGCNYFPFSDYNLRLGADFIRMAEAGGGVSSSPNYSLNDEVTMVRLVLQAGF
ncbi:MAG: hypothetical protein JXQ73_31705 [Phycisphaerae bacterium]|nr:hypothetical protein [Phycisphaerae bacterium]